MVQGKPLLSPVTLTWRDPYQLSATCPRRHGNPPILSRPRPRTNPARSPARTRPATAARGRGSHLLCPSSLDGEATSDGREPSVGKGVSTSWGGRGSGSVHFMPSKGQSRERATLGEGHPEYRGEHSMVHLMLTILVWYSVGCRSERFEPFTYHFLSFTIGLILQSLSPPLVRPTRSLLTWPFFRFPPSSLYTIISSTRTTIRLATEITLQDPRRRPRHLPQHRRRSARRRKDEAMRSARMLGRPGEHEGGQGPR
jgi:hypothetical protein